MKVINNKWALLCKTLLASLTLVFAGNTFSANTQYQTIDWNPPTLKFADMGLDPAKTGEIANGGQIVIYSHPQDFTFWNARSKQMQEFKDQRMTYVISVINAPAEEVRQMVWDLEGQGKFSPLLKKTKNLSTQGNTRIASFEQIIKVPILKLASEFVVQLDRRDNGDIGMVLIGDGDVESLYQYWEFFPLGENKTLTVLSGWQDIDSASLMYKIILEAEPAIGEVFPILTLYERLTQFKNEADRRRPELKASSDEKIYDIRSVNGFISDNPVIDKVELKKLAEMGSVQFYQAPRKLSHDGEIQEVIQVSAVQYVPLPKPAIKPLLNDFTSLAEYNELTDAWLDTHLTEEDWGHLQISLNIGPIHIPVEIYLLLEGREADKMLFHTTEEAYMYPLFGHVEYIDMPEQTQDSGTIVELTIGGVVGPEASFLFKMARYLPFHNVLIAAAYSMLTADNAENWVVNKVAENNQKNVKSEALSQLTQ